MLSSTGYEPGDASPDQFYDPTSSHLMTDTGGGLQLLCAVGTPTTASDVHDRVMWLDPVTSPVMPSWVLPKPGIDKSLQRLPNDDDEYISVHDTLAAFAVKDDISPFTARQAPAPVPVPTLEPIPTMPRHLSVTRRPKQIRRLRIRLHLHKIAPLAPSMP